LSYFFFFAQGFGAGDKIGFAINMSKGTVTFFRNGTLMQVRAVGGEVAVRREAAGERALTVQAMLGRLTTVFCPLLVQGAALHGLPVHEPLHLVARVAAAGGALTATGYPEYDYL
jgi:hypothetical protein